MKFDKIIIILSEGRSGSNAVFSWFNDNMTDHFSIQSAHNVIFRHPIGANHCKDYNSQRNLLLRSEFSPVSFQITDLFLHYDMSDGEDKNVYDICNEFYVFHNMRDFYNFVCSTISFLRDKKISLNEINKRIQQWKERTKYFTQENEENIFTIKYNKWDVSPDYRKQLKSIFSDDEVNDSKKEIHQIGYRSLFETNNRHRRFNELDKDEFELFQKLIKENKDACELSDEIFGKVYNP